MQKCSGTFIVDYNVNDNSDIIAVNMGNIEFGPDCVYLDYV